MNSKVKRWEVIGIILIIGFGTTLHFWFEWTDYWRPMALIAAVNESTWEHFKMAFWPGLIFAIIEYPFLKKETNNFLVAKALGLLTMPIVTMILFYGYTSITDHNLIADIIVFILSVIAGQLVSLKLLTTPQFSNPAFKPLAAAALLVMTLAFSLFSYYPFENFLFEHPPETGEYGILDHYDEHDH